MAKLINLPKFSDHRGNLTVFEKELPFVIKRIFYIYDVPTSQVRGGHGHFDNRQVLICLSGSCRVDVVKKDGKETFNLEKPNDALLLEPEDWHQMSEFKEGSVLLVLASHIYDEKDYFTEIPGV